MSDDLRCDEPNDCPPGVLYDCEALFGEPVVIPAREGGTIVQWSLAPEVRDEGEYVYTLQTGNAGVEDDDAWQEVVTEPDVCFLVDPKRRLPGVFSFTHYRIKLVTDERTYYSPPLPATGKLGYEDWRTYVAVLRAEHVQLSRKSGIRGLLHKRRISGLTCSRCRDFNTDEVRDAGCPVCLGTGWVGGYYRPVPCSWFNVSPGDASIRYDLATQGPITNTRFEARALASPLLISGDIWTNGQNSERYRIMIVQPIVETKGVPVVYQLAIERLPFSDISYTLPRHV